jgi:imidazole glycerol-phosphate synthase subunit HisH
MISIIDVGVGNFNSASNMIKKLGFQVELINDYDLISKSDTLILPGVGRFDIFIEKIFNKKIDIAINNAIMNGAKILGICVGMQVLLDYSEEGSAKGLGLIEGDVKKFDNSSNKKLKIPHMGWNNVFFNNSNKIFDGLGVNKFYFIHSYYADIKDKKNIIGMTNHGYDIPAVINKDRIYGVQFHPEKSHQFGAKFIKNFLDA